MYNNTQRNRAGALEELNKFFLGKDEQIALSDLRPLRSPQVMPRGYQDPRQVMPRGYQDGAAVTPDTVTINTIFTAPNNEQKEFSATYNTGTGLLTPESKNDITAQITPSVGFISPETQTQLNAVNWDALSESALKGIEALMDLEAKARSEDKNVAQYLGMPKSSSNKDIATAAITFIGKSIVGAALGGPLVSGILFSAANWAAREDRREKIAFQREKRAKAKAKAKAKAEAEEEKTVPVIEQNVESTVPPTQTQPQLSEEAYYNYISYLDREEKEDFARQLRDATTDLYERRVGWQIPKSDPTPVPVSTDVLGPPQSLLSLSDRLSYLSDPNTYNMRTGRSYRGSNWETQNDPQKAYDQRDYMGLRGTGTGGSSVVEALESSRRNISTAHRSGINIANSLNANTPVNSVATISDTVMDMMDDPSLSPTISTAESAIMGVSTDPTGVSTTAPVAAVPATVSDAPTFLGLPVEYSYPGTTRSYSRSEFAPQDPEGYSGAGVDVSTGPGTADPGTVGFGPADPGPDNPDIGTPSMQEGGEIDNADTDLESRFGPMGVIRDNDGAPGPSRGGAGVSDDLTMEVPVGSYVLNSDAVNTVGSTRINDKIKEAYDVALASGQEVPADPYYNPEDKVVIRISNGEALIPKPLVGPIGQRLLEKWNNIGLEVRAKREQEKEKMMAQQKLQGPQVASEAPPVQPQSPIQAQMGGLMIKPVGEGSTVLSDEELDEALKELPKEPPIPRARPKDLVSQPEVPPLPRARPKDLVSQTKVPPLPRARPKDLVSQPKVSIPNQTFYDDLYTQISEHEEPRLKVYDDKVTDEKGNVTIVPTVGIGYNLNNATAQQDFRKIGANYNAVKKGAVDLTETQMRNLYDISVERAEEDVRSLVPDFDNLPANIQKVLIDMSFNLGKTRLTKFSDMLKAVNAKNPNYTNMKKEMINSIWYKQVGIRSKNLVKLVEEEIKGINP
jgi:GH24 family phage-related lysozyme (muramidase)